MTLDATTLMDRLGSHAAGSGLFERVVGHEPKNAPGNGLSAAVWVQSVAPVALATGLSATSARIELRVRIYSTMTQEPLDGIDPAIVAAVDVLLTSYSGDFDLGGLIRNVDLLGAHGAPLSAQAGYLNAGGSLYRVMDITVPCIVNDCWPQA